MARMGCEHQRAQPSPRSARYRKFPDVTL